MENNVEQNMEENIANKVLNKGLGKINVTEKLNKMLGNF